MNNIRIQNFCELELPNILEMLAKNVSVTEILEDFPDLELADIQACLIFAAQRITYK